MRSRPRAACRKRSAATTRPEVPHRRGRGGAGVVASTVERHRVKESELAISYRFAASGEALDVAPNAVCRGRFSHRGIRSNTVRRARSADTGATMPKRQH